jgi:hypothetical protein
MVQSGGKIERRDKPEKGIMNELSKQGNELQEGLFLYREVG